MGIRKLPRFLAGTSYGEFHLLHIRELDDDDVGGTPNSADEETPQTSALANELWCSIKGSGYLFGNDCFAGNIVLQINKLRYKDGKGDPTGFVTFLDDCLAGNIVSQTKNSATKMVRVTLKDLLHFWMTTIYLEALYHGIEATDCTLFCTSVENHSSTTISFCNFSRREQFLAVGFDNPTAVLEI